MTGSGTPGGGITGVGRPAREGCQRATAFYRDVLGLPLLFAYGELVFFACGGTRLYLQGVPEERWAPGSIIYFTVGDIAAAHEELAGRGVAFKALRT